MGIESNRPEKQPGAHWAGYPNRETGASLVMFPIFLVLALSFIFLPWPRGKPASLNSFFFFFFPFRFSPMGTPLGGQALLFPKGAFPLSLASVEWGAQLWGRQGPVPWGPSRPRSRRTGLWSREERSPIIEPDLEPKCPSHS